VKVRKKKREGFEMKHGKAIIGIGLCALIFFLFLNAGEVQAATYYGKIVAIEGNVLQVRGSNGKISVFFRDQKVALVSIVLLQDLSLLFCTSLTPSPVLGLHPNR
jgi:hypothetical protein